MGKTLRFSSALAASVALVIALAGAHALARKDGYAVPGCDGCHKGSQHPAVSLQFSPANPAPGSTVTLEVAVEAVNGNVGGLYVLTDGRGELVNVAGQGTKLVDGSQLVHSAPKQASGGAVHFTVSWVAPGAPGGIVFKVWGLSANGDNSKGGGDAPGYADISFAYGCTGTPYYKDYDGDGYGDDDEQVVDCTQPEHYTPKGGDCDEIDADTHPDRSELCNNKDDDCDGEVDENLEETTHYQDADGDGHGTPGGATVTAVCPPDGFAPTADDCDDANPDVHADMIEVCNYIDDDCDGRIDESVREICGVGMCAREASSCGTPVLCTPGQPSPEQCNMLDDDCNGAVDESPDLCGPGAACRDGACVPGSPSPGGAAGEDADAGSSCALDPGSAPPWGMLALLSPLCAAALRRRRNRRSA